MVQSLTRMSKQHAQAARRDVVLPEVREERIAQAMGQNAANQQNGRAVRLGGRRRTEGGSVQRRETRALGGHRQLEEETWRRIE